MFLLIVLFAGPSLERSTESIEPDWVLVLLDRTQSMTVADAAGETPGVHTTRDAQLRSALEASKESFASLAEGREIRWFGIGESAHELRVDENGLPILGDPSSRRTRLGGAIKESLRRSAARPLAGMLVVSDGRSLDLPDRALLRPLSNAGAPLHTVLLGSTGQAVDVAIRTVSAPKVAYKDDPAPVTVEFFGIGEGPGLSGELRLLDETTGGVLATQSIEGKSGIFDATIVHKPEHDGQQRWRVEFVPNTPDLITVNNSASVSLDIVDRPVRVLYLDGYPRWEQRYLRNLLIREATVESSNLMLAANRRYIQEGDLEVTTLPISPEEWAKYDVVILGDLDPGVLTPEQTEQIRLFVADEGGGIVWIGGESDTPSSWWSTPLAALLPFSRPAQSIPSLNLPVHVFPTAEADRLGVLRLGAEDRAAEWPQELSDSGVGWSALHWAQRIDSRLLKPTASVLAYANPISEEPAVPLVLTMRYGAGRVVYIATDEIWRWRYGRGEVLYERFWIQILRLLGREHLIRGDDGFRLSAASDTIMVGDALPIVLEIIDQSLLETAPEALRLRIEANDATIDIASTIDLELRATPGDPGRYDALWTPPAAGGWTIIAADPTLQIPGQPAASIGIQATRPGGELLDPRPDHDLLRTLAEMTGGRAFEADELPTISDSGIFPSRSVRRIATEREALWDTPLAFALLLILAGTEWIGRRIMRVM